MVTAEELNSATAVVKDFFHEMADWERWCAEFDINQPSEETREVRLAKLVAIFDKYLTPKARQRDQARYESLRFDQPPEFAREVSNAEPDGHGRVWVYSPAANLSCGVRYLLEREGESWKIALMESDFAANGKWSKSLDL